MGQLRRQGVLGQPHLGRGTREKRRSAVWPLWGAVARAVARERVQRRRRPSPPLPGTAVTARQLQPKLEGSPA